MTQAIIETPQFEIRKAEYPNILSSGGLGPCIAIGLYDRKFRAGYMLHEPHMEFGNLEDKLELIRKDFGTLSRLKVFAAGAGIDSSCDPEDLDFIKEDRLYTRNQLKKYFKHSQVTIKWSPRDSIAELFLNTCDGKFLLKVSSLRDYQ